MTILVTGGAGFIGANFVIDWLQQHDEPVVNLDKLTYAGNLASLQGDDRHIFIQGDICDQMLISQLLADHRTRAVINFAARSTAPSNPMPRPSPRATNTSPTAPTAPARPPQTIWCVPAITPTACRCSPPTAPIIMASKQL